MAGWIVKRERDVKWVVFSCSVFILCRYYARIFLQGKYITCCVCIAPFSSSDPRWWSSRILKCNINHVDIVCSKQSSSDVVCVCISCKEHKSSFFNIIISSKKGALLDIQRERYGYVKWCSNNNRKSEREREAAGITMTLVKCSKNKHCLKGYSFKSEDDDENDGMLGSPRESFLFSTKWNSFDIAFSPRERERERE